MERVGSLNPNKHTIHAVIRALKAQSSVSAIDKLDLHVISKAELDSHANIVVLGNNFLSSNQLVKLVMSNHLVLT